MFNKGVTAIPAYEDKAIENALDWFLSFMSVEHWKVRKADIEARVQIDFKTTKPSDRSLTEMTVLSVKEDKIGWYLYLIESLLKSITKYELVQGARVAPIFKSLGEDLDLLKAIGGIEDKMKRLMKKEKSQADSILFEMLTALCWAKNGWNVSFIPEAPPEKRPDLLAKKDNQVFLIECKRLAPTSDYSKKERNKWLRMLSYISSELMENNLVLDIVFHVELESLSDDFLKTELIGKLPFVVGHMHIASNSVWDVHASFVDMDAFDKHLLSSYVKNASTQMNYLIGGERAYSTGFSSGIKPEYVTIGDDGGNNLYIEKIYNAFGVDWKCDCDASINSKSRDIWHQLKDAISQFPDGQEAVIHVGLETLDGTVVQKQRFEKIFNTASYFKSGDKHLKWIFVHFFQSYTPIDQTYVIDETVSTFGADNFPRKSPLNDNFLVIPWGGPEEDNLHWLKERP